MHGEDLASVYDLLYVDGGVKDYQAEAADLAALVRTRCPSAWSALDDACGTGEHLRYLRQHFDRGSTRISGSREP